MTNGFLDKQSAATYCDVSERTVERWIRHGLPIFRHTGKSKVLIRPVDIEAFLQREQATSTDQYLQNLIDDVLAGLATPKKKTPGASCHASGVKNEQE